MISIITPTFNRASLLPRMIKSVQNQIFKDWELIIIDDGSTDNTEEVAQQIKDLRIKYYLKENTGAADSRNFGVEKASGPYIVFLDSDDEAEPDWLRAMVHEVKKNQATVVTCGYSKLDHNGKHLSSKLPSQLGPIYNNIKLNFLSGTLLIQKDYFIEAGGYDHSLASGHHTELLIRLIPVFEQNNAKISIINKSLINIHLHQADRIRHNHEAIYSGTISTLIKHEDVFLKNRDIYYNYLSVAAISAFKTGRMKEGKQLLLKGTRLKPFSLKSVIRLLIGFTPFIRTRFWKERQG